MFCVQSWCVLYLHGVSNTRGYDHRVGLYKVLLASGFTVLAIDYRGFGDSSATDTTEETVVEDARVAISWTRDRIGDGEHLLVWGHSLGAAIACRAVAEEHVERMNKANIAAVVLESPFNNMEDELNNLLFASKGKILESVGKYFPLRTQLKKARMLFQSDRWVCELCCPTLIIHAEDDDTIAIDLARRLYKAGRAGGKADIDMVCVPGSFGFGHSNIYKYHKLPDIVNNLCQI